jgi:hypothetical protein
MALNDLVSNQAQKSGFSQKETARALRKLKEGGMMAQIAPQLQGQFMSMNPNATPRERLRQKLGSLSASRQCKDVKVRNFEKQKMQVEEDKVKEEEKKQAKQKAVKNQRKKLKDLEKRIGVVNEDMYLQCIKTLEAGSATVDEVNRCNNIVSLYAKQQCFRESINIETDLDDLIE